MISTLLLISVLLLIKSSIFLETKQNLLLN